MPPRLVVAALLASATLAVTARAQEPADRPGHSRHGAEFDEGPRRAAYAMPGINPRVHVPVAGLDAPAQKMFDQGICQLHGFWFFEAERSFREVARRYPDCAMAHLGMALANFEGEERAAAAIANAVKCSASVPKYEQLWIDAFAAFHGVDDAARTELRSGDAARAQKQKDALVAANKGRTTEQKDKPYRQLVKDLGTLVHEFPDDVEAKAFLAVYVWHAYDWGSGIPIVSHAAIDALLDVVFAKVPDHPAHHYRIHLWDQEKAERALRSCPQIGGAAPGIAHQWHMAGHIYAKLDRHLEAAWHQDASGRVDHAHMQRDRVLPFLIHNYGHNQEWLARSLSCVGEGRAALEVAKNLVSVPRHPKWNKLGDGDSIAAEARARLLSVCEDHELWAEAVALERDGWLDRTTMVRAEVQRLGLLGRAHFRLGQLAEGDAVVAAVDALLVQARAERAAAVDQAESAAFAKKDDAKKTRKAMDEAGREPTDGVRSVLDLQRELRGERLLATGDAKAAVVEFEAVADFPKTLLADAHLAAGDAQKAIELLEKEVKEHPHRVPTVGRLLHAYGESGAAGKAEHKDKARELVARESVLVSTYFVRDADTPLLARVGVGIDARPPIVAKPWWNPANGLYGADFGPRPALADLGPHGWAPFANVGFTLPHAGGGTRTLPQAGNGKATLVVFYLGFGCLHCVQQLQALAPKAKDFAAAGIELVAIGNETLAKTEAGLLALGDGGLPFPLLADPELGAFRAWQCHDDFESLPLHGTFLVDGAGLVRWQDLGAEPFTQFEWLLGEAKRLLALPTTAAKH
ncbi:MAG: redoxin domain-containing protein [Planctomycetes bacterium]|nr:redoxin domain-containing protein [Planctomycetota bacterium]